MADAVKILNNDEFFGDFIDTPKEGIEQHRKREYLKSGRDRTQERIDKESDENINRWYVENRQRELNEKENKNWKGLGQACR